MALPLSWSGSTRSAVGRISLRTISWACELETSKPDRRASNSADAGGPFRRPRRTTPLQSLVSARNSYGSTELQEAEEVSIRTEKHPDRTVVIWVVVAEDELFVRSRRGTKGRWYRCRVSASKRAIFNLLAPGRLLGRF